MVTYSWLVVLAAAGFAGEAPRPAAPTPAVPLVRDASDAFFGEGQIPRLRIRVEPDQLAALKKAPREYVRATLQEDDNPAVPDVALKLKGAAGSFREWDDRPALTLNVKKFRKGGKFHDLEKFHLNNSVQDETYLNELLAAEVCLRAGIPAARVTHARVWINDRDVGVYVFKEGFDKLFLRRWFAMPKGNLYDGGFLTDITDALEKDEGDGPDDRRDLKAIVAAGRIAGRDARARKLETLVDMDEFCSFMAVERLIGHWDGYVDKANNYRIYFNPQGNKAVFLPHGMDQVFGDSSGNLLARSDRLIGSAIKQSPELWKLYQARVEQLLPLVAPADGLLRRVEEVDRRLDPVVRAADPSLASRRRDAVAALKGRLVSRAASLRQQLDEPRDTLLAFNAQGVCPLPDWKPQAKSGAPVIDEVTRTPGGRALHMQANSNNADPADASWRCRVTLEAGRYTLKTLVVADKVVPWDRPNGGVGVRISGVERGRHLVGSVARSPMTYTFLVTDAELPVDLVLELRAVSGQVWFQRDSLQLVREKLPRR